MTDKVQVDMSFNIYEDDSCDYRVALKPWPEVPDNCIALSYEGFEDCNWKERCEIIVSLEGARKLAKSLLTLVEHIENEKDSSTS